MKFLTTIIILSAALITSVLAVPAPQLPDPIDPLLSLLGLDGLLTGNPPPQGLATTIHSPQCADYNNGTYVCCQSTFNGGLPIVQSLSAATDYPLTKNTINGLINCQQNFETCYPGTKLCCGSINLMPTLALWCQQVESSSDA